MRRTTYCRRLGVAGWFLQSILFTVSLSVFQMAFAQTRSTTKERRTNPEKAIEDMVKMAKKACSAGDYQKGVELLADLYVETNNPTHVFNQGRCYEQNNRFDEALARFREYQRNVPEMPPEVSQKVNSHIAECEEELAKRAARNVALPQHPDVARTAAGTETASDAPLTPPLATATAQPTASAPNSEAGRGLRIAGITTAVAGVVLLGAGVAFNIASNKADAQVRDGAADKVSTRDKYETLGWVGYGAGGVSLIAGTVLYVLGYRAGNSDSPKVSVLPTSAQGQASLIFSGVF